MEFLYALRRLIKDLLGIPLTYADHYKFQEKLKNERAIIEAELLVRRTR